MRLLIGLLSALIAAVNAGQLWAGGSGLNVIVVVNQNSTNSVQLGNPYDQLEWGRGLLEPERFRDQPSRPAAGDD